MTFEKLLDQAIDMLRRRGRVTNRAPKLHFQLDDDTIEVLKDELLYGQPRVVEADDKGLVWTGAPTAAAPDTRPPAEAERQLHTMVLAVMALLRRGRGGPARRARRAALPPTGARGGRPGARLDGGGRPAGSLGPASRPRPGHGTVRCCPTSAAAAA